jgi:putative spermidine/putrescine transport system substrate-binding protein
MNESERLQKLQGLGLIQSRRNVLIGLGAAAGLASFGVPAKAAGGTIIVSNWGGDWNERTRKFVEIPLLEDKGYKIVHDLGMEPERKAKLLAERAIRRGSIDVIHLNSSDGFEMKQQDAIGNLDFKKIPNSADLVKELRTDYFVPWLYSGVVIIYNKDKVPNPPKSYQELWDPKWAGKLGLTNQLYFNYMLMAGLVKGGNMTSVDAGRDSLVELREKVQPRIYAGHQQLAAGLANGEVDIAVNYKARGLQWIKDGLKLGIQYPAEGAIAVTFGAGMPQKAPNPDDAYAYLNAMIDPAAMAGLAAASFYAPANAKADLSPELRAQIDFSEDEKKKLKFLDYGYVAKNTSEWLEWWTKNVTRS